MAILDTSIVNVALPTLSHQLNASASQSIWVTNAYQLGSVMLLLPLAAFGEMLGYRRVYMTGMAVFTLASAICIFAPTLQILCAGRALQGMGAAGVMSMTAALVRHTFPGRLMGRALGGNAFVIAASAAAAPSVAAAILSVGDWRWLFAANIPLCVFALALGPTMLPRSRLSRRPLDVVSALLSAVLFGALVIGAELVGRNDRLLLGCGLLAASAASAVILVRRSWAQPAPLFPIDLLRIPLFGLSILSSTLAFGAQLMGSISLPFLLQLGLGRSVVETGFLVTPWAIATVLAAPLSGILADRLPGAILNSAGLVAMAAGMFLLAAMPADIDNLGVIWRSAICGAGFGFFQTPNTRTVVLVAPHSRSGATGGALATARTIAQSLGAVAVALLFSALPLGPASRWALAIAGGLSVAGAVVSSLRLRHALPSDKAASDAIYPD
jgi:DHA2 family multidrug resistance protein-like MFS transporter